MLNDAHDANNANNVHSGHEAVQRFFQVQVITNTHLQDN